MASEHPHYGQTVTLSERTADERLTDPPERPNMGSKRDWSWAVRPPSMTGRSSGLRPNWLGVEPSTQSDLIIQGSVLPDIKWRELGACRGLEPETFYPLTEEEADQAKAVCAQCSVQTACLEFALAHREKEGIWGGATERERRRIIRQRRRSA